MVWVLLEQSDDGSHSYLAHIRSDQTHLGVYITQQLIFELLKSCYLAVGW